jgi:outer membrane immunogenic protein
MTKMMRLVLGVAAALMLFAGPAAADGMPTKGSIKAAPMAAGPNWNGFYVGVGIGAGAVVADKPVTGHYYNDESEDSQSFRITSTEFGGEGVFGTVTIGYDRVLRPGWVGGVFADYDFASSISSEVFNVFPTTSFKGSASIDQNHSWSIGGRLGFLTSPGTLIYGTVGYTQTDLDVFHYASETFSGYFVGAGIETFLRDNWTLKLEYRYSDYGSETVFDGHGVSAELDPSTHTARLVLSYKFGHPHD